MKFLRRLIGRFKRQDIGKHQLKANWFKQGASGFDNRWGEK